MRFWGGLILCYLVSHISMAQFPSEYQSIPEEVRNQASVTFVGTYFTTTTDHQQLPDGSMRWRIISGFRVMADYSGIIKNERIEITPHLKVANPWIDDELEESGLYLVLLKPQPESLKIIKDKHKSFSHLNLVTESDILAIRKITK